jgi:hypothetical protein
MGNPGLLDIEFVLEMIDNALADKAERSDEIRKYGELDRHGPSLVGSVSSTLRMAFEK